MPKKCGAKTRNGGSCRNAGMSNGRCKNHGGLSLAGIDSPSFKDGRYSKYLPTRLAARYEEALADPTLISVADEAAVVTTFITESLQALDLDNCQASWEELERLAAQFEKTRNDADLIKSVAIADSILGVIQNGVAEWHKVARLLGYVEVKRKLSETEAKRMKELQLSIPVKEANDLIGSVLGIINKRVTDHATKSEIAGDLARLVNSAA